MSTPTPSEPRPTPPGLYRHYKGQMYEVLDNVHHSETQEALTLYRALYGDYGLWVRPTAMFQSTVVVNGVEQARFAKVPPPNHPATCALSR